MSYKVIHYFTDLQDFNHPYKVGDIFPRLGINVSEKRLRELSSKNNKQGKPLIEKIEETKEKNFLDEFAEKEMAKYTKTEINRMSTVELRNLANSENVKDADKMTGSDLKKVLIKRFGL